MLPMIILIFLLVGSSFSQPDSTFSSQGFPAYIVNYGAIKGDMFLADFAARRFVLIDEQQYNDGQKMIAINPNLKVLKYRCMVSLHTTMTGYDSLLNPHEWAFLHSCDPANISFSRRGDTLCVSWSNDRRFDTLLGYLVILADHDSSSVTVWEDSLITGRFAKIVSPPWRGWLRIATVDTNGDTLEFSHVWALGSILPPPYHIGIDSVSFINGTGLHTLDSLKLKIRVSGITPESVLVRLDVNHNRRIDPGETFPIAFRPTDSIISALITWDHDTHYHAGRGFKVVVKTPISVDTIPKGFYMTTNINNRLRTNPYKNYVMNIASPLWRNYTVDMIEQALTSPNYNGVFSDNTSVRVARWMYEVPGYPFDYDSVAWYSGACEYMDSVVSVASPGPVIFNGMSDTLLDIASGAMKEGFCYSNWGGLYSGRIWETHLNNAINTISKHHKIFLALPNVPENYTLTRIYTYASYLLIADDSAYYANARKYSIFAHFPEMDLPIGTPIDTAESTISELRDSSGCFIRRFTGGLVVVNPTDSSVTPSISIPPYKVRVTNGTTMDGSRLFVVRATTARLAPHSAAIFLNDSIASPNIQRITFSPEMLTDSTANKVMVKISSPGSLYVEAALHKLGLSMHTRLYDDGTHGDTAAGDSVFTTTFEIPLGATADTTDVKIVAYNSYGLVAVRSANVIVKPTDTLNILPNWSFEWDVDNDMNPDGWRPYYNGFIYDTSGTCAYSGHRSIMCQSTTDDSSYGAYMVLDINQTTPKDLLIFGYSKAESVGGVENNHYSIYVDGYCADGTRLYGECARFHVGTHDWQYSSHIIHPPSPIRRIILYALFRRHTGKVWFDHFGVYEITSTSEKYFNKPKTISIIAFPNPFNKATHILIPEIGGVKTKTQKFVDIYDITGHIIAKLPTKDGRATWKPQNEIGSGIYFASIKINGKSCFAKLIYIK